ncbi:hypothetical protein Anapl_01070 [Anas platyrhynchos]|uniref:Uncharacterized protein n=1 Tax=Anas platyrhynchos TaxID=8839 RepID=R0LLX1_ANAPL|nr:hypothetical protein Anapl_01070 [Anas platyrhynchos]
MQGAACAPCSPWYPIPFRRQRGLRCSVPTQEAEGPSLCIAVSVWSGQRQGHCHCSLTALHGCLNSQQVEVYSVLESNAKNPEPRRKPPGKPHWKGRRGRGIPSPAVLHVCCVFPLPAQPLLLPRYRFWQADALLCAVPWKVVSAATKSPRVEESMRWGQSLGTPLLSLALST